MQICQNLSLLSHDTKHKVATIIVTNDFREICSIGYNGDYKGGPNNRSDMRRGHSNFLHSEENALFHLGRPFDMRQNLILMCTHKPCTMCAKRIVNGNIRHVLYDSEYVDELGQTDEIFSSSGVKCNQISALISAEESTGSYLSQ